MTQPIQFVLCLDNRGNEASLIRGKVCPTIADARGPGFSAEALAEYLARHAPDEVTEDMNAAIAQLGEAASDPFVTRAARRVLTSVEW